MNKIFTAALALMLSLSSVAEDIRVLTLGIDELGVEPQMLGLGISPDGRYVCGSLDKGNGVFVADMAMGGSSHDFCADSELRKVDKNGLGIGYMGDMGVSFTLDGDATALDNFEGSYKFVIGEDITNSGSVMVGSLTGTGFLTYAAYSRNGGEWTTLPEPPADQLGRFSGQSSAKGVSGDGRYIIGHAGSFGPFILWTLGTDGEYEPDAVFARFCATTKDEMNMKPLAGMSPQAISNNGKYVLCAAGRYDADGEFVKFPVVYNTETKDITLYDAPQDIDPDGYGLTGHAIADDGTFIGIIGDVSYYGSIGCFIMKAGETQAELFVDAFPKYAELFEVPDMLGMCVPTDMSADGSSILGHVFYASDYFDNSPAFFLTYVIKTTEADSVEAVSSASAPVQIYSIDGMRLSKAAKGLNIVRNVDGSVTKVLVK